MPSRQQHDLQYTQNGSMFRIENIKIIDELRTNLSNTFSTKRENTFLTPNFSIGFNTILEGFGKNQRFLILKYDYPTLSYAITSRGFAFYEVSIDKNLEQNILGAIEKFKPTVFAFSMVQYTDYTKNKIYEDKKQSLLPTDQFMSERNYLSLSLEPGHLDTLNFGTLNQRINFLNAIGLDIIEKTNQELANKARQELYSKGLIPDWLVDRKEQSSIINFPLEKETLIKLKANKIICTVRGANARISFHFYNTEENLNEFLEALK